MRQATLATAGFERDSKPTRQAAFLDEMNRVVPWRGLGALSKPVYPKPGNGRVPIWSGCCASTSCSNDSPCRTLGGGGAV